MRNSRGEWELMTPPKETPLGDIHDPRISRFSRTDRRSRQGRLSFPATRKSPVRKSQIAHVLTEPAALEKIGTGTLCVLSETDGVKTYGRAQTVADRLGDDRVIIAKWVRRLTNWNGRQAPLAVWKEKIAPLVEAKLAHQKTPVVRFRTQAARIVAQVSIARIDHAGACGRPRRRAVAAREREVLPADCARCALVPVCRKLPAATGTALLWRRLGLVDAAGVPTLRGQVVSFFSQGDGLAIAAALEDNRYPLDELIYDLANLDAGFASAARTTAGPDGWPWRAIRLFGLQSIPGYLENGVPPKYGAGAEQIVASIHKNPQNKHGWVTDLAGGPVTLTASSSSGGAWCARLPMRPNWTGRAGAACRPWRGPS